MNCNLTDEERKTQKARCRSWDCSACNNFYSNCLNEELNKQTIELEKLKKQLEISKEALKFYTNAANWEHDIHPQLGPHVIMLNEKDTTLVDNKIVGGFIAKMALDDLEIAGK